MTNSRVRIYELSRELNLENKDILAVCEQLNIAVKSHSSTITESDAERIRSYADTYVATQVPSGDRKPSRQQGIGAILPLLHHHHVRRCVRS
ncbi:MAG: hypothetical protein HC925_02690, partial [Coleofasciculaceae cyanobacterium SM2_3_26]|nr:hypothetical protein [Coleofasciculaceae cyanobacterium SM2_3_26]